MIILGNIELIKEIGLKGRALTIGNFDGVHVGHRALLSKVIEEAKQKHLTPTVLTFNPHPLKVLTGQYPPVITPLKQKFELLEQEGIELIVCLAFDKQFASYTAEEFVKKYLVDLLNAKYIVVGYDYRFGKDRKGDFNLLKKLGEKYGFSVSQVDPVYIDGDVVSSTRIRNLVQQGKVRKVRPLLGRYYQVFGEVIHGHKRGGEILNIPTANLELIDELVPKPGVYAVYAELDNERFLGVANVGYNPTFGNNKLSVEVHILDFNKNIYQRDLRVHFVERIRDEKKFSSIEELKKQILKDIEIAREILKND